MTGISNTGNTGNTMGLLIVKTYLVLLGASLLAAAPDSFDVLVQPDVSAQLGHTVTLPCWLSPQQNAESLEVRWFRDSFDSPVMLYRLKKFEHASQEASYVGRVSFGSKDAASGGLKAGDVSLKLVNATQKDVGDYTCYVSSDQRYESAHVRFTVTETGTPLLLSAVLGEGNMVNMSCESAGWYPKPSLWWSDLKKNLTPTNLKYSEDSSGLLSVHSWLLVSSSSEVSCSVGLSGEDTKEARLRLHSLPTQESGSSVAGWVAFAIVILIAVLGGLGLLFWKKRMRKTKSRGNDVENINAEDHVDVAETKMLLPEEESQPIDLSTARTHYVNVTPVESKNPFLKVKGCILRDTKELPKDVPLVFPPGEKITCLTAIRGTLGFSSGKHYWEVSLGNTNIGLKESWWLGVTSATDIPMRAHFIPAASDGYWYLSSSKDRAGFFQFFSEPQVALPVCSRPQTVGVYLDYDSGELSFYNVERQSLIGSLKTTFTGEVFPLFNPGIGDKAPIRILHQETEGAQSDMVNSVDTRE